MTDNGEREEGTESRRFSGEKVFSLDESGSPDDIFSDHIAHPRGHDAVVPPGVSVIRTRPVCGDTVELSVAFTKKGCAIRGVGSGCAVNRVSTSLLCETMAGRSLRDCHRLLALLRELLRELMAIPPPENSEKDRFVELADAIILGDMSRYPARVPCVLLAWEAFGECLTSWEAEKGTGADSHPEKGLVDDL